MRIDLEKYYTAKDYLSNMESVSLYDIEFYADNKKLDVDQQEIEHWVKLGLSKQVFITYYFEGKNEN